ncbi:decarboxylase, partial [Dactylosporangium sp. NPDC051485]
CCGLTPAGMTAYDLADAAIKRAIIASAHRIIAAAEPAKFSRTALAYVTPVSALSMVVTTDDADDEHTNALTAAGTIVHKV